jgi:serine/threonine protein kinase
MLIICHGLRSEDFTVEPVNHEISLGSDISNSIAFDAEGLSERHAVLSEEDGILFIRDNGSSNGTFLNHRKTEGKQKVSSGDIIQVGCRQIRVDVYPDQKVTLNFISAAPKDACAVDATAVTIMPAAATPVPASAPATQPPDVEGTIERTMVASDILSTTRSVSILTGGAEIGKYIIVKRIGKGGMGEVFLAKHKTLGTYRALKVLPKELMEDNAKFFERFIREAKLASEIRHPNVVGVMDVETDTAYGLPYIVMEYIDGGSLRNSLTTNKKLSEEQAVVIVEAIASALRAAEEHKVVHRDIKPDNIMFTKQGEVKLADLGIAKNDDKDNDLTKTNMMIGTPAYLPPEQAQNAKGVDGRADIYSLGATFYEMLTGQHPYPGNNTIEILHKLFADPVPDPRKVNPEVSPASAAIVMKMLAKNPKDRFQNASELLETMDKTFPPHTPYEAGELIKKVIAGECQNSTSFTSSISTGHFFLWTLKKPHKWLIFSAVGLFVACCVVGILLITVGKRSGDRPPQKGEVVESASDRPTEPVPVQDARYDLQIVTTPDSEIRFISPDGQMKMYSADHEGLVTIPGLDAGNYKVRISRINCRPLSRDFELKDNMTLDVPLEADLKKLVIKARPDSEIRITGVENGEKTIKVPSDGSVVVPDLLGETVFLQVSLPGWETYEQTLLVNKDMELQAPQKRIRVELTVRTAPYAEVVLKQNGEAVQSVKANSVGLAVADGVPAGEYQLEVSVGGYHSREVSCNLDRSQNLNVELERITFELQIDAEAETQLMVYMDHQLQGTYLVPDTGRLQLTAMPQGKYSIAAEKKGKTGRSFDLILDKNQTLDCHLEDASASAGTVPQEVADSQPGQEKTDTQVAQQDQSGVTAPPEDISEEEPVQPPEEKTTEGAIKVYFMASTDVMDYVKEKGVEITVGDRSWSDVRTFPWSQTIEAGLHRVCVRCDGLEEKLLPEFEVSAGQENECLIELSAKPSKLHFVSNQDDALITFNNATYKPGQEVEFETFREFAAEGIFGDEAITKTVRSSTPGDELTLEFNFMPRIVTVELPKDNPETAAASTENTPETATASTENTPETATVEVAPAAEEKQPMQAEYENGMKLFNDRKYKDALKAFAQAAEAGNKDAAKKAAEINERGLGMWFSDSSEAVKWYRKAAELGDRESAAKVARAIDEGDAKGTAKEMLDFYLQAAPLNQPEVLYRISNLYRTGYKDISQDDAKALQYLRQAAELGLPDAMFDLGIRYEKGDGVVSNIQTALIWINKAADAGHDKAQRYRKQLKQ